MSTRLLCIGDLHLGWGIELSDHTDIFSAIPVWERCVEAALQNDVDAVLLTGDLVDSDNRYFESLGPISDGLARLAEAAVPAFAVGGNHDATVLKRLTGSCPNLQILGQGGCWEEEVLHKDGMAVLRIQGWSFAKSHFSDNPLTTHSLPDDDLPTVALLHCDVNASGSRYAPVPLPELLARPLTAWILGHIHAPQILHDSQPLIFYTGSPQGLDPSETGRHGPWLLDISNAGSTQLQHLPLCRLRWEKIACSLENIDAEFALQDVCRNAIEQTAAAIAAETLNTGTVSCRLQLTGRTVMHAQLPGLMPDLSMLSLHIDGVRYCINAIEDHTLPKLNLEEIRQARDPAGLLAERLWILERNMPEERCADIINKAKATIIAEGTNRHLQQLRDDEPLTCDKVRELLLEQGYGLLEKLLAQKAKEAHS